LRADRHAEELPAQMGARGGRRMVPGGTGREAGRQALVLSRCVMAHAVLDQLTPVQGARRRTMLNF
jgi:hypothetical protein